MHEAKFTEEIVEAIQEKLKSYPDNILKPVKVRIGETFHVDPDAVQFYFDVTTKGTRLEGMKLDIEEEFIQIQCQDCRRIGGVEDHHLLMCSFCDSTNVKVLSGNQVFVELIEEEGRVKK